MSSITITFGDRAVNHEGMQMIGQSTSKGYSIQELIDAQKIFEQQGYKCELVDLNQYLGKDFEAPKAAVLVIRRGVQCLLVDGTCKQLFEQLSELEWDSKVVMYGKVVNKHARHNLCFSQIGQQPDYQNGKGRIIEWKKVPLLSKIRDNLAYYFDKANQMVAEGNYYYNIHKCGVGFHGDAQRKKVIAVRLCTEQNHPLHYQWFHQAKPIGKRAQIHLQSGDMYVMSEKAVGTDWRKMNSVTLRHATGSDKFTTIK